MHEVLRKKGHKATPARLGVLQVLKCASVPLSAEEIATELNKGRTKRINAVTVYRTLGMLLNDAIVRKVDLRKDSAYFELADNHHHHIVCTQCNTTEDFNNSTLENALCITAKNSSLFSSITDHRVELFGTCNNCITK